jgi:hypothetical protein
MTTMKTRRANHGADEKGESAKREIAKRPGKDDVHEQREPDQKAEGMIRTPAGSPSRGERRP